MVVPQSSKKEQVLKLIDQREAIERKLLTLGHIIGSQNEHVGMNGPLIDAEGYPRADIDVRAVRVARHEIICLQNDQKALFEEIEKGLHEVHAEDRNKSLNTDASTKITRMHIDDEDDRADVGDIEELQRTTAFARVEMVSPGSPGETAGLQVADELIEFGSINSNNFNNLEQLGEVMRHRINDRIIIKIRRNNETLDRILIPKSWQGRGLLGCSIVRVNNGA